MNSSARKVLVVDDEKPTLSMFRLFLQAYGFTVFTAENGEQGLEAFRRESPEIVVTDIKMPGMDGIELLRRIKDLAPLTEVIVITGHGDMDLAITALNLDATDFINKPIQKKELDLALKRAVERIRLARASEDEIGCASLGDGGEVGVIEVKGSVTSRSEAHLQEAYRCAVEGRSKLLLRFSENASINGAGIAILTQLLLDCQKRRIAVAATGLSENFRKVFGIVGIARLVEVRETETEALQILGVDISEA